MRPPSRSSSARSPAWPRARRADLAARPLRRAQARPSEGMLPGSPSRRLRARAPRQGRRRSPFPAVRPPARDIHRVRGDRDRGSTNGLDEHRSREPSISPWGSGFFPAPPRSPTAATPAGTSSTRGRSAPLLAQRLPTSRAPADQQHKPGRHGDPEFIVLAVRWSALRLPVGPQTSAAARPLRRR